jgi:hypothetical protein
MENERILTFLLGFSAPQFDTFGEAATPLRLHKNGTSVGFQEEPDDTRDRVVKRHCGIASWLVQLFRAWAEDRVWEPIRAPDESST